MFLNEIEKDTRLNSDENLLNRLAKRIARSGDALVIRPEPLGRKPEIPNIPPLVKEIAATAAITGVATNKEMAESFGISAQTISNVRSGRDTDKEVQKRLTQNLEKVRDVAVDRLMKSLGLMDDEKLENCKARDLSGIAANLSRVVEKTLPKQNDNPMAGVQVIFYAPRMRNISDFEVIDIEKTA